MIFLQDCHVYEYDDEENYFRIPQYLACCYFSLYLLSRQLGNKGKKAKPNVTHNYVSYTSYTIRGIG